MSERYDGEENATFASASVLQWGKKIKHKAADNWCTNAVQNNRCIWHDIYVSQYGWNSPIMFWYNFVQTRTGFHNLFKNVANNPKTKFTFKVKTNFLSFVHIQDS